MYILYGGKRKQLATKPLDFFYTAKGMIYDCLQYAQNFPFNQHTSIDSNIFSSKCQEFAPLVSNFGSSRLLI